MCNSVVICSVFAILLGIPVFGQQKGILSDVFSDKPDAPVNNVHEQLIGPTAIDDGCERQYPLTPVNNRSISLAYHRYKIVPQIYPFAPAQYVEVL